MPVAVMEALASGRPVVATAVGGIPEQIEEGRTGFLVPPSEPDALADALTRALARAWSEVELREASRRFWLATTGAKLATVYEELLNRG